MDALNLNRPQGIHRPEDLGSQKGLSHHALQLTRATRLADLAEEFAFFTHAPLFACAGWDRDPVLDYLEATPACEVHVITCNQPLFEGLEVNKPCGSCDKSWNFRLMACHKDHWVGLRNYLMSVGGVNRARRLFHRTLVQIIPIIDGVAMDRLICLPETIPMINIMTFSIDSNLFLLPFVPATNPPFDRVRLKKLAADPETVKLAEAYFSGHPAPYQVIEPDGTQLLRAAARGQDEVLRRAMAGDVRSASPEEMERLLPHINEARRVYGVS